MKARLYLICKIVANVFCVLFGLVMVLSVIADANAKIISTTLNAQTQEIITNENSNQDSLYFKSDYESIADVKANGEKLAREVVAEGSVLLKNKNNALPLTNEERTVSLFSSSSVNFIYAGGGSSYSSGADTISLKTGLETAGFTVNSDLWNWYSQNPKYSGMHTSNTSSNGAKYAINDAPWSEIPKSYKETRANAAIFVLARYGTEATDLFINGDKTDMTNGNYLALSPNEITVLEGLKAEKAAGTFDKIIVLMNSATHVECDFIDDARFDIDAVLWIGEPGTSGTLAVGDLLAGNVNPSGRLTDTFWMKHAYNPVYANWGAYNYDGNIVVSSANSGKSNSFVVYQEGIYNGYRYTETRYEDKVLSQGNAGDFNYDEVVAYPFGYGLSYETDFVYSGFNVKKDGNNFTVSVTVTNNGKRSGKEVVQIYLQKPYTEYDKENGVEKASVELAGYAKTGELAANGGSETVTVTVEGKYFASYDAYGVGTYLVDAGEYFITAAKNAHSAVNNILAKKGKHIADGMTEEGNANLVYNTSEERDEATYSKGVTGNKIENRFDNADLNLYEGRGTNSVTYITRSNWAGTVKFGFGSDGAYNKTGGSVKITATEKMSEDAAKAIPQRDDKAYPTYGADNGLTLVSLRAYDDGDDDITNDVPIPYDDELWEDLLDQLTWEETVLLLSNGLRSTAVVESVNKPETIDGNGALGPVSSYNANSEVATNRYTFLYDDPDKSECPTQYPCNGLLAATYNDKLIEEMGTAIGEDCLWAGYAGIYGPGANIHRGSYNGRHFEYYSEDGFLSGKICAAEVRGIQSKGCYVYLKHAILNEMETNREGVNTWVNEQTIRELYLLPFRIAIEEAGAPNVMTGFNRIGVVWTGQHGYIDTVLRGEYGMTGFAVSDYWQSAYMSLAGGILGGSDLPDGSTATSASASELNAYAEGYGEFAWKMRECAHRILYTVVHSSGVNGFTSDTIVRKVTPWWQTALLSIEIVCGVLFGASALACAAFVGMDLIKKKQK